MTGYYYTDVISSLMAETAVKAISNIPMSHSALIDHVHELNQLKFIELGDGLEEL